MPGHTARYCLALADLYAATGDEAAKKKALSGFNALTYMQSDAGLFRTMFQVVNEKTSASQSRGLVFTAPVQRLPRAGGAAGAAGAFEEIGCLCCSPLLAFADPTGR